MSIANLGHFAGPVDLDALAAAAAGQSGGGLPPPGLPDPALLTRLANAYFAAKPGDPMPLLPDEPVTASSPSLPGIGISPMGSAGNVPNPVAIPSSAPSVPVPVAVPPGAFSVIDLTGQQPFATPELPSGTGISPSLPGFGASPSLPGSGQSPPLPGLSTSPSLPGFGKSPSAVPSQPFDQAPVSYSPVSAAAGTPSIPSHGDFDAATLNGLIQGSHPSLPKSIDAGPTAVRTGTISTPASNASGAPLSGAQTGADRSSIPEPPSPEPPAPVLVDSSGVSTPRSGGTPSFGSPFELPFQKELAALLAPLTDLNAPRATPSAPANFYFLDGISSVPTPPGATAAAPFHASELQSAHPAFDIHAIRRDFPILSETVHGRPLIWFDNAATTQKPQSVIDRISYFYAHENSNIHRAAHELAARATDAYEGARQKVARFLGAGGPDEIIFTRGTTEAINLVAASFGRQHIRAGDEIVITHLEHHANIVPWQLLCLETGAKLRVAPVDDCGALRLDEFNKLLTHRTKLVAFSQVSNALGTITPAKTIVEMAHRVGAKVLVDGAQSVSHMKVDVQDLDADFFVFSGHKLFAPTGIGALYGKKAIMDSLQPYQSGGNMIRDVTFERTEIHDSPQRFEAGTGNIADAVGLGAAIDYVERIGLENIGRYEHGLLVYATERLRQIPNLTIIGNAPEKASVISFVIKGLSSEDIGSRLNRYGIAVRAGHHCAQPILRRFGQETTVRPSFAFYNTCEEIDVLVGAVKDIQAETGLTRL